MPDTTDPAASALRKRLDGLDAIRLRRHSMAEESVNLKLHAVTEDFRRLLAAVEAALKLPAEWRQESEALRDAAGKVWEDAPDAPGVRLKHAYAAGYAECAKALEAAITAALAGKEAGHE